MTRPTLVLGLLTVAATVAASPAEAQTTSDHLSFDRLALLINQGDRISVTDRNGRELHGRLIDLSPGVLSLRIDYARHDLEEAEISIVRRRHRDSLKNGAISGFISGAVVAAILMRGAGEYHPGHFGFGLLFGAAGAAIGIGFDAAYAARR